MPKQICIPAKFLVGIICLSLQHESLDYIIQVFTL